MPRIESAERIVKLETQMTNMDNKLDQHCINNDKGFEMVLNEIRNLRADVKDTYATKEEIRPLRAFVYGTLSLLAVTVAGFMVWVVQRVI